jgi:hypothetical protein
VSLSLSIVDFHDPYQEAQLRGHVVERRPDDDFKYRDPNSLKYTGKPFPFRSPEGRVALVIEIKRRGTPSFLLNIRRLSSARSGRASTPTISDYSRFANSPFPSP